MSVRIENGTERIVATGAAVLAITIVLSVLHPSLALCQKETDEATERFKNAVKFYEAGNFEAALADFKMAYDLKPSFKILFNIATIYGEMGKGSMAFETWKRYLKEGGEAIPAEKKATADAQIAKLKEIVALVTVVCNVEGASLFVDGKEVGTLPLGSPAVVDAGTRELEVRAKGYYAVKKGVILAGGTEVKEEINLTKVETAAPPPTAPAQPVVESKKPPHPAVSGEHSTSKPSKGSKKKLKPVAFWAVMSLGLASGIIAIATGATTISKDREIADMYDYENWKTVRDERFRLSVTADVMIAFTAALAASAIALAFYTDFGKGKKKEKKASVNVTPMIGKNNLGAGVGVSF